MGAANQDIRQRPGVFAPSGKDDFRLDVGEAGAERPRQRRVAGGEREDLRRPATVAPRQVIGGSRADGRIRRGRDPDDLAREFEPTAQSIRHWVGVADRRDGRREEKAEVVTSTERDELIRLRRENKQLRQERDILSRAAAWFARETGAVPSGSSNS